VPPSARQRPVTRPNRSSWGPPRQPSAARHIAPWPRKAPARTGHAWFCLVANLRPGSDGLSDFGRTALL